MAHLDSHELREIQADDKKSPNPDSSYFNIFEFPRNEFLNYSMSRLNSIECSFADVYFPGMEQNSVLLTYNNIWYFSV